MPEPRCWCGAASIAAWSADYLRCDGCGTLILAAMPGPEIGRVVDEERDFYGRRYWTELHEDLEVRGRARADLHERCLHWLRSVLRWKLPPGAALELGSGSGSFVALLRWAGFDAAGLDLSPWVVAFARETFGVPMLEGPLEDQDLAPGSLDLVALMDVVEHLPDPLATMRRCAELLRPGGMVLIQTPRVPEGASHEELAARADRFLDQLKPGEHLYLWTEAGLRRFLEAAGLPFVALEPAIFAHYDQAVVAAREPLVERAADERLAALSAQPSGRLVQALFDRADDDRRRCDEQERNAVAERSALEADRAARLEVIERQGLQLAAAHAEVDRWLGESKRLWDQLHALEAERNEARLALVDLRGQFDAAELDRAARLRVIEAQGRDLGEVTAERNRLSAFLGEKLAQLEFAEADRAARLEVIERQGRELAAAHAQLRELPELREALLAQKERAGRAVRIAETRAQELRTALAQLRQLQEIVSAVQGTRVFKVLRRAGRWGFFDALEGAPLCASADAPSEGKPAAADAESVAPTRGPSSDEPG